MTIHASFIILFTKILTKHPSNSITNHIHTSHSYITLMYHLINCRHRYYTFFTMTTPSQMKYNQIWHDTIYSIRALRAIGWTVAKIRKNKPSLVAEIAQSTLYYIASVPLGQKAIDNRKKNTGRPACMNSRDKGNCQITQAQRRFQLYWPSVLSKPASTNDQLDFQTTPPKTWIPYYLASRKKGLISETDKKKRVAFAKDIKTRGETEQEELEFWRSGISMYVDIVGFKYKLKFLF